MKTLKKTLCLVLALVMVFGLCVTSASAKLEYTDNDDIEYKEAVDVMSGIGILAGDARGFRPTDTITRAEAAKIIAYIMVGDATQADALKTTTDPFSDVPASHWASGYIAYCATAGIIAGMGDGYHPNDNVTGLQFAKMLLCALGYGVNDEYVGTDWAINVSRDALRLGVFDSNLAGANNNPATREECALYAFNVIHGTEEYDGIQKVTYSALVGNYITDSAFDGGGIVDSNKHTIFGNDFDLYITKTEEDAFQRPQGHHWYVGKSNNIITADYGSPKDVWGDDADLQASYTTGVTGADLYNLLGATFIKDTNDDATVAKDFQVYVDGKVYTATDGADAAEKLNDLDNFTKGNTKTLDKTGNGVETNVYAWSTKGGWGSNTTAKTTNHLIITVVNTYMAKVDDVKAGTATKDPVTKVVLLNGWDADATPGNESTPYIALDTKGFNTEEFKEKDYVLVTAAWNGTNYTIQSMAAPTVVEDTVSRYVKDGSKITVTSGGTEYVAAKNTAHDSTDVYAANDTDHVNRGIVDAKEHTLYVDEYGYLVAAADVDIDSEYVYVAQFGEKNNTSDDLKDTKNLVADIYYADGTHKIVTINTKDKKSGTGTPSGDTENAFSAYNPDAGISGINVEANLTVYELTMVKGKAVLTKPLEYDGTATANTNITKGISSIDGKKADGKTVFFYVHVPDTFNRKTGYGEDGYSVTAYVGINNVPVSKVKEGTPEAALAEGIGNTGNDKWKAVVADSNFEADSTDTVYFYTGISYGIQDVGDGTYDVTYVVYVDGEKQELTLNYKDRETAKAQYEDADNYEWNFFCVKDNANHDFTGIANDDKVINKSKFHDSVIVAAKANFDGTTIYGSTLSFSYNADEAIFVDLRDVAADDLYTSISTLQRDFNKTTQAPAANLKFAVKYADNASKQISVIYLIDAAASITP